MAHKDIDEYLNDFDGEVKKNLVNIRKLVQKLAPEANETMTYGVPTFKLNDEIIINFAAFKGHYGIYPEPETIIHFKEELAKYETSKGAIKFPFDEPLPLKLIERIVKYKISLLKKFRGRK